MPTKDKKESMKIVPPGKKRCVWMEAGVVSYKLCDNNYDCPTCVYDHAMQQKTTRVRESSSPGKITANEKFSSTWVERMMRLPASRRKCRYMITGEVDRKICPNAYECGSCPFDVMMQDRLQAEPLPVIGRKVESGIELAPDMYYHEGHAWAKPEYGGRVRVGVDDFGQRLLGRLGHIEMPEIGQAVGQGIPAVELQGKRVSASILSPIDGIVSFLNQKVLEDPSLLNESPYENGWLFVVEPTNLRKNLKTLYYGEEAGAYLREEKDRLVSLANEDMRLTADGGAPLEDVAEELGSEKRDIMVKTFFRN